MVKNRFLKILKCGQYIWSYLENSSSKKDFENDQTVKKFFVYIFIFNISTIILLGRDYENHI